MRLGSVVDPIASFLLDLRTVSLTQWVLRSVGAVALVAALLGALPGGLFGNFMATLVALIVTFVLLVQCVRPDSDIGAAGPLVIILALAGQDDLSVLRAVGIGFALLASHAAFALAATIPIHGEFDGSAWRLGLRGLLPVLALSVVGILLVVALAGFQFGPWMLVLGVLAVIALFVLLMPRVR